MTEQPLATAWQTWRTTLVRFVTSRVRDHAAAEDIVHDALLRAFSSESALRDREKLAQWLFRITNNAIIDHYRAHKPSEPLPIDLLAPEPARDILGELVPCLAAAVAQLPEHYREAIELSELQGLTQQETAARLGISLSGAKSRVQRGRAKIEEILRACCHLERDHRGTVTNYEPKHSCGDGCVRH